MVVKGEEEADGTVRFSSVGKALGEEGEGAVGEGEASRLAGGKKESEGAAVAEAGGDVYGVVEGGGGGREGGEAEDGTEKEESAGAVVPEAFEDGVNDGVGERGRSEGG